MLGTFLNPALPCKASLINKEYVRAHLHNPMPLGILHLFNLFELFC
jgi:hypothetical protein